MSTATAARPRTRRTPEQIAAMRNESLGRAMGGMSTMNYRAILEGFAARGIPMNDIQPRSNVFTYNAWLAAGRQVRKGEKGIRIVTFIPIDGKAADDDGKRRKGGARPWSSTVFHISQTDPLAH